MMTTRIFTGNAGAAISEVAAAVALRSAEAGQRTLLFSFATVSSLGALLGAEVGGEPRALAPNLDVLALDPLAELAALWEQNRASMPGQLGRIASDELPLLPGAGMLLGMAQLRELAPRYDAVVVDAGAHDSLISALALPDSLRWGVRLLFGLERGPGRSSASVMNAVLPTGFMPAATRDGAQQFRLDAEQARAALLDLARTAACFVLRPDAAALAEARLAVPALQLHSLAVTRMLCGPLLPDDIADARLAALITQQHSILHAAATTWPTRAVQPLPISAVAGLDKLRGLGAQLGNVPPAAAATISDVHNGEPALAVELPGMPPDALGLTLSGDELIVRVGPYRRHLLLPDGLRGTTRIKATRAGELLVVRRRE